jgi:hypothetical protein
MATYDIGALKADLPTAKELAQFVYDKTQIALDLVGKPKDAQYVAAKAALEGKEVPKEFLTDQNPYIDRKELIPHDEIKPDPGRDKDCPAEESRVHYYLATNMPHPFDPQSDKKVHIDFWKYENGVVTYKINGPLEEVAVGSRINKFGQPQPEKFSWIDPRTPETVLMRADGTFTAKGRGLHTFCISEKGAGTWPLIDKDIVSIDSKNITDPWA